MDKEGQAPVLGWINELAGSLPFFRDFSGSDPVIYSKRLPANSTKGEVEFARDRFFISIWVSIILSIEFLIFVKWWWL